MGLKDILVQKPLNFALKKIKDSIMLTKLAKIGTIKELRVENKSLIIVLNVKGLTEEIAITCKKIKPSSDNSTLELSNFSCNIEGIQAALEMYPSITVPIPEGAARSGLGAAKLLLGL